MRPYLRAANVGWNGLRLDDVKQMNFTDSEMSTYRLQPGDVLVAEASGSPGEVGKPALWCGEITDCAFQNTLIRIRPLRVEPKFLVHWLRHLALSGAFVSESRGVGIHHIGSTRLAKWQINLPPIDEQRRIVEILEDHFSRLDATDRSLRAALARLDLCRRSAILAAVLGLTPGASLPHLPSGAALAGSDRPSIALPQGWAWRKWKDIGQSQNGKGFLSTEYTNVGVKLLRPGNLDPSGSLRWPIGATRYLPTRFRDLALHLLLVPGDVVVNLTAQSLKDDFLGRVCIVREGDECLLNQRLARLSSEILASEFLLLVFRSQLFRKYVSSLNKGSVIQHIFTKQIAEFWLPVPPMAIQVSVAAAVSQRLDGIERTERAVRAAMARVGALRRSLLSAAFSGQLTSRIVGAAQVEEMAGV